MSSVAPRSPIAVRPHSYAPFENVAYEHLAGLGVRCVEIAAPPPDQLDATIAALRRFGLRATSVQAPLDLARDDAAAQVRSVCPTLRALDAAILFVSVKAGATPVSLAHERLRRAGDEAARHGLTIVLETHPDLVTNAAVAIETMRGVDHPAVRVNFDTANVYFYNHGVDAVDELRPLLPFVAALHLKDTDGGYRHWCFPALGRGVVPFPAVFALLDGAGFAGPCTLEIEGIEGEQRSERLVCDRIAESIGYLRGLGRM